MEYRDFLKLCQSQNGVITSAQAHRVGIGNVQLHRLAARGDLYRLRRGVYRHEAVPPGIFEEFSAAWMSLYPAMTAAERRAQPQLGVLRAESAAMIHGMGDLPVRTYAFYVPERKNITAEDIELRREALPADDIVMVQGLPVTTPTRTIVDLLGEGREPEHVGAAITDAAELKLELDHDEIRAVLPAYSQRTGLTMKSIEAFVYGPSSLERLLAEKAARVTP